MEKMTQDMVPIQYKNIKEGLYLIDEYGNIYSNYKKDFLLPTKDKDGYLKIGLSGGSRTDKCYVRVATLVAWHFIGIPENLLDPTVDHLDGDIENNHYSNLRWVERGYNSSIRKNTGKGSQNGAARLKEKQVREICDLLVNTNKSYQEIANLYKVDKSTIANIAAKKNWKEISKDYDFSCRKTIRNEKGRFEVININLIGNK